MPNTYSTLGSLFTAIANAIRAKTGSSADITADDFPAEIAAITTTPTLQNKTVTPATSQQAVQADSGYDGLDTVTVEAMPAGSARTPATTISVLPSLTVEEVLGATKFHVTASGSQSVTPSVTPGYVASGAAGTVSVSGGGYVDPASLDANLVAANIKSGVSIFGVAGSLLVTGIGIAQTTLSTAGTSISFTGITNEPVVFACIETATDSANTYRAVLYDGTTVHSIYYRGTYSGSAVTFSYDASTETLTLTGNVNFAAKEYKLIYAY